MLATIQLDARSPVPLHHQLAQQLRARLDDGTLAVGDVLPAEHQIAAALRVSRSTVRQALASLVQEGRLERKRNRGTVVTAPPLRQSLAGFYSFAHTMAERGVHQHSRVLSRALQAAPGDVGALLGGGDSAVVYIERLRYAGESPLLLEQCWFEREAGDGLFAADLTTASLYDVLAMHGVVIARATETIKPVVLRAHEASLLTVEAGDAAFFVERISFSGGRAIEVRRSLIRGDRYLYSVDLQGVALAGNVS